VLTDSNAQPQLANLAARRAGLELVADVAKPEPTVGIGRLRIEQDVELLRDVLDYDVQAGNACVVLVDDQSDGGGGHGVASNSERNADPETRILRIDGQIEPQRLLRAVERAEEQALLQTLATVRGQRST